MAAPSGLAGRIRANARRLTSTGRIPGIDLARGLAVLGMFAAHLFELPRFDASDAGTWVGLFGGNSSVLFATLAGVSLAIVTGGKSPVHGAARYRASGRIALRAVILWCIGLLLMLTEVPLAIILPAYGILFLLALPLLGLRVRSLVLVAVLVSLTMPFAVRAINESALWQLPLAGDVAVMAGWDYPFLIWLAFITVGIAVGRSDLRNTSTAATVLFVGLALAVGGYGLDTVSGEPGGWWSADPHGGGILEIVAATGIALTVIGASVLLCSTPVRAVVLPLRAVGSMALTAYVGQVLAWALAAPLLGIYVGDWYGFIALDPFVAFALSTIVLCTAWALVVGRGPLEWGMDRIVQLVAPRERAG